MALGLQPFFCFYSGYRGYSGYRLYSIYSGYRLYRNRYLADGLAVIPDA